MAMMKVKNDTTSLKASQIPVWVSYTQLIYHWLSCFFTRGERKPRFLGFVHMFFLWASEVNRYEISVVQAS